jgi:hypothetical protein
MLGSNTMIRAAVVTAAAVLAAGCMTYDFEPVVPLAVAQTTQTYKVVAKKLKPNMMLLVDKSGSMEAPINPSNPNCPANCGPGAPCPASCPTRISDLRNAMATFLSQSGADARMGLTFFPTNNACGSSSATDVALPPPTPDDNGTDATLTANASAINGRIQSVTPLGGTPTAASATFVGTVPGLLDGADNRDDFILLLTDGLPNCNEQNPNQVCTCDAALCGGCGGGVCAAQQSRCKCTLSSCTQLCGIGCLDQDATVTATINNKVKGIKTIVVGFGADTSTGDAPAVLNAVAEAGDFPRTCPNGTNAECGTNNTCNTTSKLCDKKFYQATDAAELSRVLADIINNITGDPCQFLLKAQPSRPELLAVIINGQNSQEGDDTWRLEAGSIVFKGALCNDIKTSTTANPVNVEIRIVETF